MKKFEVSIKNAYNDFSNTHNVWFSLEERKSDYEFVKHSTHNLFMLFVYDKNKINSAEIDINKDIDNKVNSFINGNCECEIDYFLIDSINKKIKVNIKSDLFPVLFQRKKNRIEFIKNLTEYSIELDDSLVVFNKKIRLEEIENLEYIIFHENIISYSLLNKINEYIPYNQTHCYALFTLDYAKHISHTFYINSKLDLIDKTVQVFKKYIIKYYSKEIWKIETALHEALMNAITYGSEYEESKKIKITFEFGDHCFKVIITDSGKGFNVNDLSVPTDRDALQYICGRGIYMMKKLASKLFYNEIGNSVVLFFHF